MPTDTETSEDETVAVDRERYDRSIRLLTADGQRRLAGTHVAVVGCGGLGSLHAVMLARYGVHELTLVDDDEVERSNLPRLYGATDADVGRAKVAVLEEAVERANPDTTVHTAESRAQNAATQLKRVEVIVAGVDRVTARTWLNQYAVKTETTLFDAGVVITTNDTDDGDGEETADESRRVASMDGIIHTIKPGETACFTCLHRNDTEQAYSEQLSEAERREAVDRGYIDGTDLSPESAVIPLNGVVASKTVQMVAKHVTGYDDPADLIELELLDNTIETLHTTPRPDCVVCGEDGVLGCGYHEPVVDDDDVDPVFDTFHPDDGTVDGDAG